MAIAFDNASTATAAAAGSLQWTHTSAGTNVYVVAAVGGVTISTMAYNNVALVNKNVVTWVDTFNVRSLANANTGALTASAKAASIFTADLIGVMCSYNGVASDGAAGTAAPTAVNVALSISSTANAVCISFIHCGGNVGAEPAGQTRRAVVSQGSSGRTFIATEKTAVGATTSISWSQDASLQAGLWGVAISATAVAASGGGPFTFRLTNVGQ